MRRSSTEKDVIRLIADEKGGAYVKQSMRRSSTDKDMPTIVKGGSDGTSLGTRNSARLQERRKSLPIDDLQNGIQRMHIERIKTCSERSRSNSSKLQLSKVIN